MTEANYIQKKDVDKRVRFFDGQFLQAQDFIDEQVYHLDRQWRHNRTLHVSGIVEGLEVTIEGNELRVSPGTAVDADGRQIVLPNSRSVKIEQEEINQILLYIAYRQAEDDRQGTEQGVSGATRWLETPNIFIDADEDNSTQSDSFQYRPPPPVLLARVEKTHEGWTIRNERRIYSGLRLPGPVEWLWRSDAQGRLGLWRDEKGDIKPQLSVTGDGLVGLGTDTPQAGLEINTASQGVGLKVTSGSALFSGGVTVENGLQVTKGDTRFGGNVIIQNGSLTVTSIEAGENEQIHLKTASSEWTKWYDDAYKTASDGHTSDISSVFGDERGNAIKDALDENQIMITLGKGYEGESASGSLYFFWRRGDHCYCGYLKGDKLTKLQCPFVFTYDPMQMKWAFDTTIIYKIVGPESEQAQRRSLQRFDGRLLIREVEPEISYLDEVYVVAAHHDGRETILRHTFEPLQTADGSHYIMHQGDEVTLHFPDYQTLTGVANFWVVAKGYYIPLQNLEERNRESTVTAAA